jgi:hypothetical protein
MSQLALFAPEAPAAPTEPVSAGHRNYARMEKLMACPVIEADLMEIFRSRPGAWLDWPAFRPVIAKHECGFGLGHKLGSMARRGLLDEKNVYLGRGIGAERPGSPEYRGFRIEYRLARQESSEVVSNHQEMSGEQG